jgi:hypothetical protein
MRPANLRGSGTVLEPLFVSRGNARTFSRRSRGLRTAILVGFKLGMKTMVQAT